MQELGLNKTVCAEASLAKEFPDFRRLRLCLASEFSELEHGVPIPRRIRHADPLVKFFRHLACPEAVWRVNVSNFLDHLDIFTFHREGANMLDVLRLWCGFKQRGVDCGRSRDRGLGERIARDQIVPLGQRRREDRLVEIEMLSTKLGDCCDDLLPAQPAADDGVAAVDVVGHVFKARRGEFFAERLNRQLSFPADAAEEEEINGAFHRTAIVGFAIYWSAMTHRLVAIAPRRVPWAIASALPGR